MSSSDSRLPDQTHQVAHQLWSDQVHRRRVDHDAQHTCVRSERRAAWCTCRSSSAPFPAGAAFNRPRPRPLRPRPIRSRPRRVRPSFSSASSGARSRSRRARSRSPRARSRSPRARARPARSRSRPARPRTSARAATRRSESPELEQAARAATRNAMMAMMPRALRTRGARLEVDEFVVDMAVLRSGVGTPGRPDVDGGMSLRVSIAPAGTTPGRVRPVQERPVPGPHEGLLDDVEAGEVVAQRDHGEEADDADDDLGVLEHVRVENTQRHPVGGGRRRRHHEHRPGHGPHLFSLCLGSSDVPQHSEIGLGAHRRQQPSRLPGRRRGDYRLAGRGRPSGAAR